MDYPTTIAILGFLVLATGSAHAQDRPAAAPEARARAAARADKERAAKKACLNGEPAQGVELLTDLYVDSNDPTYIFNQGRCYEQNDRCEDAIVRFREYLRKTASGDQHDRVDAEKHIADCEALLAKKGTGAAVTASGGLPATGMGPVSPVAPPTDVVASSPPARAPGSGWRVLGLTTAAVGGVALAGGLVLNLKHNSMIRDLQADYRGADADSAQTYKTLSMVGYGLGAACLAAGAAFYGWGYRTGKTSVLPAVAAGNAGILVAGAF